ncbi:MAG: isoleucine--tRNA ligase [Planctomycetia bacterium 21-64-5]|nr:MAG: isoleucine--tRNA ligase [Planctomycetia bacterium 21-64-5]HQU42904.1 isoleucine--tRNA ligase [Pirellulales bacterium]
MFRPVEANPRFPAIETEIIRFWNERRIYDQSLARRANSPPFVFFEGPPTANGMPHPGHCLTRAIKDLFPRYRTMRGYRCERKAGWDTHGLPVEVEVCKELGIHSKEEIEAYGVEPFIHRCQESVWRYMQEWERLTERIGFWIKLDEAYVTYHQSYVESVWWSLKNLFDRGLLYQGHKIVWWWAQGGTALSSGEVGQGYREVADPSVYVRFPLVDEPGTSLLVWTTTPWTLPSNQFAAVRPELEYSLVADGEDPHGGKLIVASALVETIAAKVGRELTVEKTLSGRELIGRRYVPPLDYYYRSLGEVEGQLKTGGWQHIAWRVVPADFVTVDSGTGVVHQAPAFGEVDFEVLAREIERFEPGRGPELICAVAPDGKFTAEAPDYEGRWVKEADKDIARELRRRGLLYHQEQYLHEYPFCWRADEDPLIQYPRRSWFIRTSRFKDEMLANNRQINWLPEHIRDGRFGNFLETNVDWALSRERYWGTPLPIWVCEETGHSEAVASYAELLAKPGVSGTEVWQAAKRAKPSLPDDLKVHKPYIDAVTYDSPRAPGKRMRRVSEVIDCWYDSGAMPFAQWGYPHQGQERFASQFPADFISEALDQTRGWFYSQLAISTLLFGRADSRDPAAPKREYPHPFRNCIVLGLMLGEDGQKMSKSKRNYREPREIFDRYGADALRWYFFANQAPWTSIRYNEQAIKDSIPEFLLRLWNVYSFFVIYANIDKFDPGESLSGDISQLNAGALSTGKGYRPVSERNELDRWILSELNRTALAVTERMDAYDNFTACGRITAFVDALSNWYVRRSRDRYWSGEHTVDKLDAYWTLYDCLLTTTKLIAPFVPFLAETLWQNLAVEATGRALESVHLCDYPAGDQTLVDEALSEQMELVREIVSLGRSARMGAKLKVRQPLAKVEVVLVHPQYQAWLEAHTGLIREELNVKQVEFIPRADQYITYTVLPDLKRLGPRLGKRLPALKQALAAADAAALLARLEAEGQVTLDMADGPVTLDSSDIQVRLQAKPGWAAAQGTRAVVVVSTELTDDLLIEGVARELVHAVQNLRKEKNCQFTDRIMLSIVTDSADVRRAIDGFGDYIRSETLAVAIRNSALAAEEPTTVDVAGQKVTIYVKVRN